VDRKFTELPLLPLRAGAGELVAFIEGSSRRFAETLGVRFERTRNDLDHMDVAHICTNSGVHAFLVYYLHAPKEGVEVHMDAGAPNQKRDLADVLDALGELGTHVIWKRDDL
jgi:hypothetical protein